MFIPRRNQVGQILRMYVSQEELDQIDALVFANNSTVDIQIRSCFEAGLRLQLEEAGFTNGVSELGLVRRLDTGAGGGEREENSHCPPYTGLEMVGLSNRGQRLRVVDVPEPKTSGPIRRMLARLFRTKPPA